MTTEERRSAAWLYACTVLGILGVRLNSESGSENICRISLERSKNNSLIRFDIVWHSEKDTLRRQHVCSEKELALLKVNPAEYADAIIDRLRKTMK